MKNLKFFSVLLFSLFLITGMAQQQVTNMITYKQGPDHQQNGPAGVGEACPVNSIFSQPPSIPTDLWAASTSDSFFPYLVYENFTGVTDLIGTVHFWGLNLLYDGGWYDCTGEDPMTFEIKFYQDNANFPGNVVYSETIQISRIITGLSYAGYPLYHYKAVLSNAVSLAGGWISIQGVSNGTPQNCVFLWMSSEIGDSFAYQFSPPNMNPLTDDLSLCFEAGTERVPLAPWALILGAVLIAGTIFMRYRRII
jgi:hypothetical protein